MTRISNQGASAQQPGLHPRNKHIGRYDFGQLVDASPALASFVKLNAYNDASIDFANPQAVKALNQALLKCYYAIENWDIPPQYLCPPIPGRADYLHYLADLLAAGNAGAIPRGKAIQVLDIGVGANVIYPLIGQHEYGWGFVGADIDATALVNAQRVVDANSGLSDSIALRLQASSASIFNGLILPDDRFDLTMCNPPFHASLDEANAGTRRKLLGLDKNRGKAMGKKTLGHSRKDIKPTLNFGGQSAELYCAGGEAAFINNMVSESSQFGNQCLWFTTLVSKATNLPGIYRALKQVNALQVNTINMAQGHKKSRVVAWTFMNKQQQTTWRQSHWQNT